MKKVVFFCIGLASLMLACGDDNDNKDELSQSVSSLTFECVNNIQISHFSVNNSSVTMNCSNYGGCNESTKQCVNPPIATQAPKCVQSYTICESNVRFVCNDNQWVAVQVCANGCNDKNLCKDEQISVVCQDGVKKCENGKAYVCAGNSWGVGTDCANGCDGDVCKVEQVTDGCVDGVKKCESGKAYVCAGNSWGVGTDCANGCDGDVCKDEQVTDGCVDGVKKCEAGKAYVCAGNSWGTGTDCANGCDGDVCKTVVSTVCENDTDCAENEICRSDKRCAANAFVTKWEITDTDSVFRFSVGYGEGHFKIDWGDGTTKEDDFQADSYTSYVHEYSETGTYIITVTGDLAKWTGFSCELDSRKQLVEIMSFGDVGLNENAFYGSGLKTISAKDIPNSDKLTTLRGMFARTPLQDADLSQWDTSNVTDMSEAFANAESFNSDLSRWNTSKVTDMHNMFEGAKSFNRDLSQWDTSKVSNMSLMFKNAALFNSNLSQWNVSSVTNMDWMFNHATSFNSDIGQWDVSHVKSMNGMFDDAAAFNADLSGWVLNEDVGSYNMGAIFKDSGISKDNMCKLQYCSTYSPMWYELMQTIVSDCGDVVCQDLTCPQDDKQCVNDHSFICKTTGWAIDDTSDDYTAQCNETTSCLDGKKVCFNGSGRDSVKCYEGKGCTEVCVEGDINTTFDRNCETCNTGVCTEYICHCDEMKCEFKLERTYDAEGGCED